MCSTTRVDQLLFYRCTSFLFKETLHLQNLQNQNFIVKEKLKFLFRYQFC